MSFLKNKKIVLFLVIVLAVAASTTMCVAASSSMNHEDFGIFEMDVPKNVELVPIGADNEDGLLTILYINNNTDSFNDVMWVDVWLADSVGKIPSVEKEFKLINKTGNEKTGITKTYKYSEDGETVYWVIKDFKNASSFGVLGQNLKTLKKMAKSIELKN